MLAYRNLDERDCEYILQNWVGRSIIFGMEKRLDENELLSMIHAMQTKLYEGNYYEMFGILNNNVLVGTFSLRQRSGDIAENALYFGIEIEEKSRKQGIGAAATMAAFEIAKGKGYKKIYSQLRIDNAASLRLHLKCGFEIIEKTQSTRGHEVYNLVKIL